jgi:hypothetical protein
MEIAQTSGVDHQEADAIESQWLSNVRGINGEIILAQRQWAVRSDTEPSTLAVLGSMDRGLLSTQSLISGVKASKAVLPPNERSALLTSLVELANRLTDASLLIREHLALWHCDNASWHCDNADSLYTVNGHSAPPADTHGARYYRDNSDVTPRFDELLRVALETEASMEALIRNRQQPLKIRQVSLIFLSLLKTLVVRWPARALGLKQWRQLRQQRLVKLSRQLAQNTTTLPQKVIPICGYCRKTRDHQGIWRQQDKQLRDRGSASYDQESYGQESYGQESYCQESHGQEKFSHGMCPDCFARAMRQLDQLPM